MAKDQGIVQSAMRRRTPFKAPPSVAATNEEKKPRVSPVQFLREVRAAELLSHKNIVTAYAALRIGAVAVHVGRAAGLGAGVLLRGRPAVAVVRVPPLAAVVVDVARSLGPALVDEPALRLQAEHFGALSTADSAEVAALIAAIEDRTNTRRPLLFYVSVRHQAARTLGLLGPEARAAIPVLIQGTKDTQDPEFVEEAGKETASQRRRAALVLRLIIEFLNDALTLSLGGTPKPAEPDDLDALRKLVERTGTDRLLEVLERCLQTDEQIDRRVQLVLVLEALMDAWGQTLRM